MNSGTARATRESLSQKQNNKNKTPLKKKKKTKYINKLIAALLGGRQGPGRGWHGNLTAYCRGRTCRQAKAGDPGNGGGGGGGGEYWDNQVYGSSGEEEDGEWMKWLGNASEVLCVQTRLCLDFAFCPHC